MKSKRVKLTGLFLLGWMFGFAQVISPVLARNIKALENYTEINPLEKVHLHLDRQLYFPGDTVWFKAYVVAGTRHKPSKLSGILYVELISPKDSVDQRLILKLDTGTSHAEFALPYNIRPGPYHIRAYTNWMRNAGAEHFYDQMITVSGFSTATVAGVSLAKNESTPAGKIDLQFFPEGGDLINDIRTKVAFKAIDQNGFGVAVHGSLFNDAGTEELTFDSQHLGMGSFWLQPQKGESYFAKVTAGDGSTFNVPLPAAADKGFTLSVNSNSADSVYLKITERHMPDSVFYLLAQSDGRYCVSAGDKLTTNVFRITLPKNVFQTGIVQFTLFGQNGDPLNERLVFIQNPDLVDLTLASGKQTYAPGEAVKFSLGAIDPGGVPDIGKFSVSVVDETRVPANDAAESTIMTDLLLKSEITGYIEAPNYYFEYPTDQTKADLDLLMLTQGYRRFEWKKMMAANLAEPKYQAENGLPAVSGTVKTQAGAPIAHGHVILTVITRMFVLDTLTDTNGKFTFDNLDLPDTAKVVINARTTDGGNNVLLVFDKHDYAPVSVRNPAAILTTKNSITAGQAALAYDNWKQDSLKNMIQLKEVSVKSSKIPPFHPDYAKVLKYSSNLNGPGQADQVITGDVLKNCTSLPDCLHWLIRGGVRWHHDTVFSMHKAVELVGPPKPMAVVLDGVIMNQIDALKMLSGADISSVEVLTSAAYIAVYGETAAGGLLIITTKHGESAENPASRPTGIATYSFSPYAKARQFYSPKYAVNGVAPRSDSRKTIFWSPDVATDSTGKTSFEYFNAGTPGNYRVVVEGIDTNGRLARRVFTYKVE